MESHVCEHQQTAKRKPAEYKAVPATRIDFTADETFPVFLPVRFTSMWVPGNAENHSPKNVKDQSNEVFMKSFVDKDRHMTSSVYNPTPYCKSKQPFATVNMKESPSKNAVTVGSSTKRRKMTDFKDTAFTVRKFKSATPYRKPSFEASTVNKESQVKPESPFSKTNITSNPKSSKSSTQYIAATWPNTNNVFQPDENLRPRPSQRFPVPYRKTSENNCSLPAHFVPEKFNGFDNKAIKKAPLAAKRQHSPAEMNTIKTDDATEFESYYLHLFNIFENLSKKQQRENVGVNYQNQTTNVMKGEKEIDKKELFKVNHFSNTRKSHKVPDESTNITEEDTSDTEESSSDSEDSHIDEQRLIEIYNHRVRLINKRRERVYKVLRIPPNVLLWLFWFLKRYLFLTLILIRLFH